MAEQTYIEKMSEDMAKIREALEKLSTLGLSRDLMIMYLQQKTKLSKTNVLLVLDAQKEFFKEAFKPVVTQRTTFTTGGNSGGGAGGNGNDR
jgi:hypothetical protein